MPLDLSLVVALGPNPAPFTELAWSLIREADARIVRAWIVVTEHGRRHLENEVLAPGAAFDDLQRLVGEDRLARSALDVRLVTGPDGSLVPGDDAPEAAAAIGETLFAAAKEATRLPAPVVFALAGGRRRITTAMSTTMFTLLARQRDRCVDIRVSSRLAEGGSGFFFPEQSRRHVETLRGTLDAAATQVTLVDVPLPRMRRMLDPQELEGASFADAVTLGQRRLDDAAPPELVVDLASGVVTVGGRATDLGPVEVLCLATLVEARLGGEADGWIPTDTVAAFVTLAQKLKKSAWVQKIRARLVREALGDPPDDYDLAEQGVLDLTKIRKRTRDRLKAFAKAHHPQHEAVLVPALKQVHAGGVEHRERLPLEPDLLRLDWPEVT